MAETAKERVIRESEQACQHAVAKTPAPYREFVTLIPQNKNIGTRQKTDYVSIRSPYMTVDGRLQMARDEHRGLGAILDIYTEYVTIGDSVLCRATVTSSLYGTTIGHAKVGVGGSGVDSTNPFENSETSAWGRALAAMGYGLFGTGVASADEVLSAMSEQERKAAEEEASKPAYGEAAPTEKHLGVLYGQLKRLGIRDGHKRVLVNHISEGRLNTSECSLLIEQLKNMEALPYEIFSAYIKILMHEYACDKETLKEFWRDKFGQSTARTLDGKQQNELIDWMTGEYSEGEYIPEVVDEPKSSAEAQPNPWLIEMTRVQNDTGVSLEDIEAWVLSHWGRGNYKSVEDIPVQWAAELKDMPSDVVRDAMSQMTLM